MFRRFVERLCERPVLAGLVASFFYVSGILAPLAMPVVVLVALRSGAARALGALAAALAVLALLGIFLPHAGPGAVSLYGFGAAGLVFLGAAELLRRGRSLAFIVSLFALLVLAAFVVYIVSVPHPVSALAAAVREALAKEGALFVHRYPKEAAAWKRSMKSLEPLSPYFLGIFGLYAVAVFAAEFFIGAGLHAAVFRPGRFGEHFRAFRVGTTLALLTLLVLGLVFYPGGPLPVDAFLPLLPLYLLQGLAIAHAWIRSRPAAAPLLFLLYALLVLAVIVGGYLVYLVFAVVSLGWMDNFLPFRRPPGPPASPFPKMGA